MVTIGIAGLGYIGRMHYQAARHLPGVRVVAAADSRAQEIENEFPELKFTDSYENLLNDNRLDALIICVPTYLHERFVVEAATRSRHILCEKPFAIDSNAAGRMLDIVKRAGVVFMVSQVLRFWPQYVRIKELVGQQQLGTIRSLSAYRLARYPSWSEWFRDPAKSGGCLLDMQVHDVDFIFWMFGHPCQVQSFGLRSANGAWEHVHTILTYADMVSSVESSHIMPASWPFTSGIRVVGRLGAVEYNFRSQLDVAGSRGSEGFNKTMFYNANGVVDELDVRAGDMFVSQLRNFLECVENRETRMICPPEESYEVMKIMTAARQSADTGQPVQMVR